MVEGGFLAHWSRFLAVVLAGALAGCTAIQAFPKREVPADTALEGNLLFVPQDVLTRYYAADTPAKKKAVRDEFVTRRMTKIDYRFFNFLTQLRTESTAAALGVDLSVLGLSAAGSVLSPGNVTQILAATSGALTGARTSYEKNVLLEQTVNALIAQMRASRAQIRTRIFSRLSKAEYSLPFVQADLQEYYFAGTIPGAIAAVTEGAGVVAAQAERDLSAAIGVRITATTLELESLLTGGDRDGPYLPARLALLTECAEAEGFSDLTSVTGPTDPTLVNLLLDEDREAHRAALSSCIQARLE